MRAEEDEESMAESNAGGVHDVRFRDTISGGEDRRSEIETEARRAGDQRKNHASINRKSRKLGVRKHE